MLPYLRDRTTSHPTNPEHQSPAALQQAGTLYQPPTRLLYWREIQHSSFNQVALNFPH